MVNEEGKAKLAYGAANSDNVRLMLVCAKGSGKLTVSRTVAADQAGDTPVLTLARAPRAAAGSPRPRPPPTRPATSELTVDMTTTEPAIDAFERNGWVSAISADGKVEGIAAAAGRHRRPALFRLLRLRRAPRRLDSG